ncbi:MAG TPA: hypothetical protein VJ831_02795 [Jatrophihabitantaceae bacterium]|nr:hypothetical protein [Jatrophihabitantaceae bacterium]
MTAVTPVFESSAGSVRFLSRIPSARTTAKLLGAGRIGLGSTFLLAPEFAVRAVGLDGATARRVVWLSQMTAGRDIAIGVGTLISAARGRDASAWVAAGAAADAVDAAALAGAVRTGRLGGLRAVGMVGGAAAAALVGFWAAAGLRGR